MSPPRSWRSLCGTAVVLRRSRATVYATEGVDLDVVHPKYA